MTQQYSIHPKYRADIDGLRAIAIIAVVSFHAFPTFVKGGFVGVDIFFVISGFLISSIIFGNLEKNSFSYLDFYGRRIKRIFPALILVLSSSYVLGWYLLLPDEFKQLGKHIAAGAGFISNLTLWNEAGYFDNASETKPLLHLWSLGIEEQFYIFWPLLLGLVWKHRLNFLVITFIIAAVSFLINIFYVAHNQVADFYSPLSRFWELMIGGILAYVILHKPHHLPRNTNWQSVIGLLLIVVAILSINKEKAFPGWWALLPTLGTFLIISSQPTAWVNRYLLSNRVLVSIGLISYPLYLWHWVLLSFLRINESGIPSSAGERVAAILVSSALAWLTYWAIEKPIRFKTKSNRVIIALCVSLALIALIGLNTFLRDGLDFRMMKVNPEIMGLKPDIDKDWRRNECFLDETLKSSDGYRDKFSENCIETQRPLIFLWGDSHTAALYAGLKLIQSNYHFGIAQYTSAGCSPVINESDREFCKNNNEAALMEIQKMKPETVLLHAQWSDTTNFSELGFTIDSLKKLEIQNIVLIGPDPTWNDALPRILSSYYLKQHKKPPLRMKENNAESAKGLDKTMRELAKSKSILYVSSLNMLCNQEGCLTRTSEDSKDYMAVDVTHITPEGAKYQAKILLDLLSVH